MFFEGQNTEVQVDLVIPEVSHNMRCAVTQEHVPRGHTAQ